MGVKPELEGWGQRIYEARTSGWRRKTGRQMSQETLAEAVGVKYQTIGQYETETAWPGWGKWVKMAETLDVTVGWLIAGEQPMERGPGLDNGAIQPRYPRTDELPKRETHGRRKRRKG